MAAPIYIYINCCVAILFLISICVDLSPAAAASFIKRIHPLIGVCRGCSIPFQLQGCSYSPKIKRFHYKENWWLLLHFFFYFISCISIPFCTLIFSFLHSFYFFVSLGYHSAFYLFIFPFILLHTI